MKKGMAIMLLALSLSACSAPTVEELKEDPEKLEKNIERCGQMKKSEFEKNEACQNTVIVVRQLMRERMGRMLFGGQ